MSQKKLSVCTPAYNAENQLAELYAGLQQQTLHDLEHTIEWIIVDDGSTDDTLARAHELSAQQSSTAPDSHPRNEKAGPFPVHVLTQKHSGRPRAINKALKEAAGKFFIVLDTDAVPAPRAFELLFTYWDSIPPQERPYFASITGLTGVPDGSIKGSRFPADVFDSNSIETGTHYGITGRKWGMYLTEALRENPYPVFSGEKFVPDELVFNRIGRNQLTRYINEVLLIEPSKKEASEGANERANEGSITKKGRNKVKHLQNWVSSPRGAAIFYNELSEQRIPLAHRIRATAHYVRFSMHAGVVPDDIYKKANKKLIAFFMLWPGLFLYKHDKKILAAENN